MTDSLHMIFRIFSVCAEPKLSVSIKFVATDARAIFLLRDLLSNGTCFLISGV